MAHFAYWLGLLGTIVGAIFGAIDLDFLGGFVGALVGGFVGSLVGQAIDLVLGPLFGEPEDRTFGKWVLRLFGLALLGVICHELFWLTNFIALAVAHRVGSQTVLQVSQGDSAQVVQDMLAGKRWQAAIFTARPLSWAVVADVRTTNRSTLDLIDDVKANRVPVAPALTLRGRELSQRGERQVDQYMQRTLLLRFLPREVWIPRE